MAQILAELLRVQKHQLDTALNNMRHGLLLFDADRRVVVINRSYLEMYGLSPEQAKTMSCITTGLARGTHRLSAVYVGDSVYTGAFSATVNETC